MLATTLRRTAPSLARPLSAAAAASSSSAAAAAAAAAGTGAAPSVKEIQDEIASLEKLLGAAKSRLGGVKEAQEPAALPESAKFIIG